MARRKDKKNDQKGAPTAPPAAKRDRKPSAKAASNAEASSSKPTKIKLKMKPAKEPTPEEENHGVDELSPDEEPKEAPIVIQSSSSDSEPEPPKAHKVNICLQVYVDHKLVHSETFPDEDFTRYHREYREYNQWALQIAEGVVGEHKTLKPQKK